MKRRDFISKAGFGALLLSTGRMPLDTWQERPLTHLTILHTNDLHSRIDPFPMDGSRRQGRGGFARRAGMIEKIRSEEKNVLLLDSGDIFQGTPYFNMYGGELEFKLMSQMKYDGATLGNHDFDAGLDGLVKQLPHANFPFIVSNYNFENGPMQGKTIPYKVFEKGDLRIGVTGVGIELDGLVPKKLYGDTVYHDPISKTNQVASLLKNDLKCHLVICLSHLGYKYQTVGKVDDHNLAEFSSDIDVILGGHTHTFLNEPTITKNKLGNPVMINQAGWGGLILGRLDFSFERNYKHRCVACMNNWVS
jgi:5'-nucleotidase